MRVRRNAALSISMNVYIICYGRCAACGVEHIGMLCVGFMTMFRDEACILGRSTEIQIKHEQQFRHIQFLIPYLFSLDYIFVIFIAFVLRLISSSHSQDICLLLFFIIAIIAIIYRTFYHLTYIYQKVVK